MQATIRKALLKVLIISIDQLKKVVSIHDNSERNYEILGIDTRQLGTVINHAMAAHVLNLDEVGSKITYKHALELSGSSPLVCRAYAIHMISTCKPPTSVCVINCIQMYILILAQLSFHSDFFIYLHCFQYCYSSFIHSIMCFSYMYMYMYI
jgi:hypothetical protein